MFEGFKPTKAEREAIDKAHRALAQFTRSDWELDNWTKQEARGYGNARDRIPLVAARGMIAKWFLQGVDDPFRYLRDAYAMRPAAVYMTGLGAKTQFDRKLEHETHLIILDGVDAYEAAWRRMVDRDKEALREAAANLRKEG